MIAYLIFYRSIFKMFTKKNMPDSGFEPESLP